jgi:hypothetical protein
MESALNDARRHLEDRSSIGYTTGIVDGKAINAAAVNLSALRKNRIGKLNILKHLGTEPEQDA